MTSDPEQPAKLRPEFRQFPDLGFREDGTKSRVAGILRDLGLEMFEGSRVVGILK